MTEVEVTLIDRSPDDAYMAVKLDGAGTSSSADGKSLPLRAGRQGRLQARIDLLKFPQELHHHRLENAATTSTCCLASALPGQGWRVKREGLQPKRHPLGRAARLYVSFHCLALGPRGDLYLNHGDPLLNYGDWSPPRSLGLLDALRRPDGKKHHYTGQGAVLKVKPDGSVQR